MEERDELRTKLGLNDPAPIQFARFIYNAALGNFGLSYRTSEPVGRMILERVPATLELSFCAAVFILFFRRADGGLYRALSAALVEPRCCRRCRCSASRCRPSWSASC